MSRTKLLAPPHPVPDTLRCWFHDAAGRWRVAFVSPKGDWRCGFEMPDDPTADQWADIVGLVVRFARKKGYDL